MSKNNSASSDDNNTQLDPVSPDITKTTKNADNSHSISAASVFGGAILGASIAGIAGSVVGSLVGFSLGYIRANVIGGEKDE